MSSAIETFRQQREAAEKVHQQLVEVSVLLKELQRRTAMLAQDEDLRAVLLDEHRLVAEVRALRLAVEYRWSATVRRWVLPAVFALASAWAAGVGYGALALEQGNDIDSLRDRAALGDAIHRRLETMTPAERRQFDRLINGSATAR
jgi:hypothetical protein